MNEIKKLKAERKRLLKEMEKTSAKNIEQWIRDVQYCFLKSDLKKVDQQLSQLQNK